MSPTTLGPENLLMDDGLSSATETAIPPAPATPLEDEKTNTTVVTVDEPAANDVPSPQHKDPMPVDIEKDNDGPVSTNDAPLPSEIEVVTSSTKVTDDLSPATVIPMDDPVVVPVSPSAVEPSSIPDHSEASVQQAGEPDEEKTKLEKEADTDDPTIEVNVSSSILPMSDETVGVQFRPAPVVQEPSTKMNPPPPPPLPSSADVVSRNNKPVTGIAGPPSKLDNFLPMDNKVAASFSPIPAPVNEEPQEYDDYDNMELPPSLPNLE